MTKQRFGEIDVMRIIGFLMVVDQHILGSYAQRAETGFGDSMVLHFLYLLGRPAVAMFIAITGFTLFHTNFNNFNIKKFYTKRMATIVAPYLFWSFATIVIFHKYHMLKNLAGVLITGTASYHLWYMGMSIRLYLWFPIILTAGIWLMKKGKSTRKLLFIAFCIFYWILLKENNYLVNSIADWLFGASTLIQKRFFQYSPIFWSIYFVCGAVVWFNYDSFKAGALKHWKKIVIIYIPLVVYMYYVQICNKLPEYFPRIASEHALYILYMILTIVVIYIVSLKISENAGRLGGWLSNLGSLSYGAYLVHVIVLQHTAEIIRKTIPMESYLLSGIIIFTATCIISFAICYIISFIPLSKYIIGVNTKPMRFIGYGKGLDNKTSGI